MEYLVAFTSMVDNKRVFGRMIIPCNGKITKNQINEWELMIEEDMNVSAAIIISFQKLEEGNHETSNI